MAARSLKTPQTELFVHVHSVGFVKFELGGVRKYLHSIDCFTSLHKYLTLYTVVAKSLIYLQFLLNHFARLQGHLY